MQTETETKVYGPGRFPNPTVQTSYILSGDVENEDGTTTVHNVLSSSSGMFYKFSVVIKKAIYGLVVKGLVLRPTENGTYTRTGEIVALKVCSKDVLQRIGGVTLENPITEIGAMQDIGLPPHPNLSTQYECCMDEKNIYSVLHFYRGVELFDHILNHGRLSEPVARAVFQQLTLALFRLQQRDIAHRDVSLENIMYDASTHAAVLIDFGLCVKLRRDAEDPLQLVPVRNTACGKATFMPPEVDWSGDRPMPINPIQSDVWSAGVCLLYALLGFPPLERACDDDVRYRYLTTGRLPELLEHWEVELSPACVDLVQMVLRPEPADRPSLAQIWAHSWMRQEGLPLPFAALLSPEEVAALMGPSVGSGMNVSSTTGLAPLQHPLATSSSHSRGSESHLYEEHAAIVEREDGEMCVSSSDSETEGEGPELRPTDCTTRECDSYRSSVDSHWSAATTPTTRTTATTATTGHCASTSSSYGGGYSGHHYAAAAQAMGHHVVEHSAFTAAPSAPAHHCSPSESHFATTSSAASTSTSTTGSSSLGSSSGGGASSPYQYFTRSRAGTPRTTGAADYAHSPGGSGGGVGSASPAGSRGGGAIGSSSQSNNSSGGGGGSGGGSGGGVFRVIHTRSMSFGKPTVNYNS